MEIQENGMQQIPDGIVQMITHEAFCRFKATGKRKRSLAAFSNIRLKNMVSPPLLFYGNDV